jgi:hypothetical protein
MSVFAIIAILLVTVLLIGLSIYLVLAFTCFFTHQLYSTAFSQWYETTADLVTAHQKAIEVFHYRPPFNKLTQKDICRMAREFAKLPDPRFAPRLMQHMDRTKNLGKFLGLGDEPDPDIMRN